MKKLFIITVLLSATQLVQPIGLPTKEGLKNTGKWVVQKLTPSEESVVQYIGETIAGNETINSGLYTVYTAAVEHPYITAGIAGTSISSIALYYWYQHMRKKQAAQNS